MPGSEPTGQEQVTPFFLTSAGIKQADTQHYRWGNDVKMWDTRRNPILLFELSGLLLLRIPTRAFL